MIGAEAIRELLKGFELEKLEASLRVEMQETESDIKHKRSSPASQDRRGVPLFRQQAGVMILTVVPVIPPDLRRWCRSMRPLRDLRSQRPLPPRHQPQQTA